MASGSSSSSGRTTLNCLTTSSSLIFSIMNLVMTLTMNIALLVCQMKRLFSSITEFLSSEVRNKTTCKKANVMRVKRHYIAYGIQPLKAIQSCQFSSYSTRISSSVLLYSDQTLSSLLCEKKWMCETGSTLSRIKILITSTYLEDGAWMLVERREFQKGSLGPSTS